MNLRDYTEGFAVPGEDAIIDLRHPATGLSSVYRETLDEIRTRYPGAEVVNIDAWTAAKAARQHTPVTWEPCSEARYHDMLNVLPPAAWIGGGFLVGEPMDHEADTGRPRYMAFYKRGDTYAASDRPMTVREFRAAMGA